MEPFYVFLIALALVIVVLLILSGISYLIYFKWMKSSDVSEELDETTESKVLNEQKTGNTSQKNHSIIGTESGSSVPRIPEKNFPNCVESGLDR